MLPGRGAAEMNPVLARRKLAATAAHCHRHPMPADHTLDLAIIGAGIAGVIHLHYARQAGLDALVLEAHEGLGGLWRELPAWQDIQLSTADWAIGDMPLAGPLAPQILANIQAWADRFALHDGIRLASPVQRARHDGAVWVLDTPQGVVRARHLVAASGGHNTPLIPPVQRSASRVRRMACQRAAPAAGPGRSRGAGGGWRRLGLRPDSTCASSMGAAHRLGLSGYALVSPDHAAEGDRRQRAALCQDAGAWPERRRSKARCSAPTWWRAMPSSACRPSSRRGRWTCCTTSCSRAGRA